MPVKCTTVALSLPLTLQKRTIRLKGTPRENVSWPANVEMTCKYFLLQVFSKRKNDVQVFSFTSFL